MKTLLIRMRIYTIHKYKMRMDSRVICILINITNRRVESIFSKINSSSKILAIKTATVQTSMLNIPLIYFLTLDSKILIKGISIKTLMISIHDCI